MEDPWPEDMERRREASVRRFLRDNPDYVVSSSVATSNASIQWLSDGRSRNIVVQLLPPLSEQQQQRRRRHSGGKRSSVSPGPSFSRPENRWDLVTTLELLEQIKDYCRIHGWRASAGSTEKWLTISAHLANPRGLEKRKYARSCQVRYENLRRAYNGDKLTKWALVDEKVQRSLVEVLRLVEHALAGSTKSPSGPSSPPPGPVRKYNQNSMEILPLVKDGTRLSMERQTSAESENHEDLDDDGDDDAVPLPLQHANDDAHGLATCGKSHPVSRRMGTRSEKPAAAQENYKNRDNDDMGRRLVEPTVDLLGYVPIAKRLRAARTRVGGSLAQTKLGGKDIAGSRPGADGIAGNRRVLRKNSKIAR